MAHQSASVKRIQRELKEIQKNPSFMYFAQPINNSLFEWHFTIRGPQDSPFENGVYHGRIDFPIDYPFKPPQIMFLNQSGRYQTNTSICLSITNYHPEAWNSAWTIRTMLQAVISTFPERSKEMIGIGGLSEFTDEQIKQIALKSQSYECKTCGVKIIDQLQSELTEADKKLQSEEQQQQQQNQEQEEEKEEELSEEQKKKKQQHQNQQLSEYQKIKQLLLQGQKEEIQQKQRKKSSNNDIKEYEEINENNQESQQQQKIDIEQNNDYYQEIQEKKQFQNNQNTAYKKIRQNNQISQNLVNLKKSIISVKLTQNFQAKKIEWAEKMEQLKEQGFKLIKEQTEKYQNDVENLKKQTVFLDNILENSEFKSEIQEEENINIKSVILYETEKYKSLLKKLVEKNEDVKNYIVENYIQLKQIQDGEDEEKINNSDIAKQQMKDSDRQNKFKENQEDYNKQLNQIKDKVKVLQDQCNKYKQNLKEDIQNQEQIVQQNEDNNNEQKNNENDNNNNQNETENKIQDQKKQKQEKSENKNKSKEKIKSFRNQINVINILIFIFTLLLGYMVSHTITQQRQNGGFNNTVKIVDGN